MLYHFSPQVASGGGVPANFKDLVERAVSHYYALNKIQSCDWLNTSLTLVCVWSVGSNVRPQKSYVRLAETLCGQC